MQLLHSPSPHSSALGPGQGGSDPSGLGGSLLPVSCQPTTRSEGRGGGGTDHMSLAVARAEGKAACLVATTFWAAQPFVTEGKGMVQAL